MFLVLLTLPKKAAASAAVFVPWVGWPPRSRASPPAAAAPRSTRRRGSRSCSRASSPSRRRTCSSASSPADDAAVYKLDDERAIVFTLDFFPPLVDDPAMFGRIAATNALNDVFAMGGTPLLALSIAAFPEELPTEVLGSVFAGARRSRLRAAGAILAGGHTIRDAEPKYGLAVVGTVHPEGIWPKSGARAGDALFLTKPLGTGLVLAGTGSSSCRARLRRGGRVDDDAQRGGRRSVLRPFAPNAVTDVTGFGLFGHAHEMAERCGVRIVLDAAAARSAARSTSRAPACAPAATRATASSRRSRRTAPPRSCSRSATTRRPPAACSSRCRRRRRSRSASEFEARGLFLARVGSVVAGTGRSR